MSREVIVTTPTPFLKEDPMRVSLSDYNFVPDASPNARGGGTVLIPLESIGYDWAAVRCFEVVDLSGRSVLYEGGGRTYYSNSEAGTQEFVGWSYWESESTEDPDGPCVHLMVLSPGFDESDYR